MHFHELPEVLKNLDDISVIHTMEKYNGGEIQERLTIILPDSATFTGDPQTVIVQSVEAVLNPREPESLEERMKRFSSNPQ